MTHFGIICPALKGHLNPMMALACTLKQRRHRVTFFGFPDAESAARAAGLNFSALGTTEFPLGTMAETLAYLGTLSGFAALRYSSIVFQKITVTLLQEAPPAIQATDVEMLLIDQAAFAGEMLAERLELPYASICNALLFNRDRDVPPGSTSWSYNLAQWAQLRNHLAYESIGYLVRPLRRVADEYRQKWNLPPQSDLYPAYSPYAQISQQPVEFEFPRRNLPAWFHFTGPFQMAASREPTAFPWERLTGQPLIYASMGTLQNRLWHIFTTIAAACADLDVQLVIALGNSLPPALPPLAGNPLVVGYAPQLELLQRATLTITHAGINTVLESLGQGVPMVAIPIAYDQPGIGVRIAWTGTGEVVPLAKLSAKRLRAALERVLKDDSYKNNALALQAAIQRSRGLERAAAIVERVAATGRQVLVGEIP